MENPYQSPEEPCASPDRRSLGELDRRPPGLVGHVRVLAILMLVQGALELVMALGFGAMAIVMPRIMEADLHRGPNPPQMPPNFSMIFGIEFGVFGAMVLTAAVLHITAGLRNYRFRGRILGIVAMAGGVLTFLTFWCLPTAIGLGVYGLIVYLNGSVSEAFRMGEAGCSTNEILTTFQR
jgi:hypothetical protein